MAWLAEAHLLGGRPDEARELARQALELARVHKERGYEAWAVRLLGEIGARRDPPDGEAAEGHYKQALDLATDLGMRPLVAHCHFGLAKLYRRTGDQAKAEEHLTTARVMYREMDMGFSLEKADAELGGVER
jgi:tetratricopeptide (TPR) repeat protein